MTAAAPWDTQEYQRIASVALLDRRLVVRFEDGAQVAVEAGRLLPVGVDGVRWERLRFTPYEVTIPAAGGAVEIPWSTIRAVSDRAYAAHLAVAAAAQARVVGRRIRQLRERRRLTGKELAARAGITPQSLSRIEHGRHDVVFITLQRLLAAMDFTLSDLVPPAPEPVSPRQGCGSAQSSTGATRA